jgi:hypothetical protein
MPTDCPECVRLWQRYAAATTAHVSLMDERTSAVQNGDIAEFQKLEAITLDAQKDRAKCKADIDNHEAEALALRMKL